MSSYFLYKKVFLHQKEILYEVKIYVFDLQQTFTTFIYHFQDQNLLGFSMNFA